MALSENPLFKPQSRCFHVLICPRLRSVFPLTRLTGLRSSHSRARQKPPWSLTRPTGSPTDGLNLVGTMSFTPVYGYGGTRLTRDALAPRLTSLSPKGLPLPNRALFQTKTFKARILRVTPASPWQNEFRPLADRVCVHCSSGTGLLQV